MSHDEARAAVKAGPRVTEREVVADREALVQRLHAAYLHFVGSMRDMQAQWEADPVSALLHAAAEGDCDGADVLSARTWSKLGDAIGDATAGAYGALEIHAVNRARMLEDVNADVDDPDEMVYRFAWWETTIDEPVAASSNRLAARAAGTAGRSFDDPARMRAIYRHRAAIFDALALIAYGDMDAIAVFAADVVGAVDPEVYARIQAEDNFRVFLDIMTDHETALTYVTYAGLALEAVPPSLYVALAGRDGACLLVETALLLVTALLSPGAAAAARLSALATRVAAAAGNPAAARRRSTTTRMAADAWVRLLGAFAEAARDLQPLGAKLGSARVRGLPDMADAAAILELKKQAARRDTPCWICGSHEHATPRPGSDDLVHGMTNVVG